MNLRDGRKGCPERGGVGDLSVSKYFVFSLVSWEFLKGFGWGGGVGGGKEKGKGVRGMDRLYRRCGFRLGRDGFREGGTRSR